MAPESAVRLDPGWRTKGGQRRRLAADWAGLAASSTVVTVFPSAPLSRPVPGAHALLGLLLPLLLLFAPAVALAVSLKDLPADPPATPVLDSADVLSRAARLDIEKELESFRADHVDARLVTVNRLDYGLALDTLANQLVEAWSPSGSGEATAPDGSDSLLLLLIDSQNKAAAVAASAGLQSQLPEGLLRSTARTTMAVQLRQGDRYRQAAIDGLERLAAVLRGGDDPGEPAVAEENVVVSNVPSREETAESNAFTWVVVLLVVGSVVPMLTWWVFSR